VRDGTISATAGSALPSSLAGLSYVQASYAERPQRTSTDARQIPAGKRPQTLPSVAEEPAPNPRLSPGQPLARANPWGSFFERKWVHFS